MLMKKAAAGLPPRAFMYLKIWLRQAKLFEPRGPLQRGPTTRKTKMSGLEGYFENLVFTIGKIKNSKGSPKNAKRSTVRLIRCGGGHHRDEKAPVMA